MKKVMIAMLALAVVFGFAACDNSTSNSGTPSQLDVSYIEATAKSEIDYLVGETPDPADFTFTGFDMTGNVVVENMASSLFAAQAPLAKNADEAVFVYNGAVSVPAIKVPVNVYEVEKLTVDATAADVVKTYYTVVATDVDSSVNVALDKYAPYAKINKTGLVVTATYNGTETKTVDAKDYDATLGTITAKATDLSSFAALDWATNQLSTDITGKDVVVKISMDNTSAAAMYKVDFKENLISSIYVDVDEDYKFYYDMDKTGLVATDKLAADKVTVLANMVNGQAGAAVAGTVNYGISQSDVSKTDITTVSLDGVNTDITVWASYLGTDDVVPNFKKTPVAATRAIPVIKDSIVGIEITAVGTAGFALDTDYSASGATAPADFTVKYKLASDGTESASGAELELNAEKNGYTINPSVFSKEDYAAGVPVEVTVTSGTYSDTATANIAKS